MNVGKKKANEELDLSKVAEAFGGYIVEATVKKNIGSQKITDKNFDDIMKAVKGETTDVSRDLETVANRTQGGSQSRPKRSKPPITGDSGQRDRAPVTFGQGKDQKRAPRKGVDYFFDPKKAKAERERTVAKRKEYEIDDKGNVTDAGVEKFARKSLSRKQQASGSNVPIELSKSDLDTAREKLVGGKPVMGMGDKGVKDRVIGTTTGKYGGKMGKQMSPKNLEKLRTKLKPQGFKVNEPPTKDDIKPKPDRVTTGVAPDYVPSTIGTKKGSLLSRIRKAGVGVAKNVAKSPVGALIGYDIGKGIISKIDKVMFPPVRGGRAIQVSAGR
tara:strand:- start:45 stop:1031 length:987 start_codon:yes stop_codon:yes gene_type:complete